MTQGEPKKIPRRTSPGGSRRRKSSGCPIQRLPAPNAGALKVPAEEEAGRLDRHYGLAARGDETQCGSSLMVRVQPRRWMPSLPGESRPRAQVRIRDLAQRQERLLELPGLGPAQVSAPDGLDIADDREADLHQLMSFGCERHQPGSRGRGGERGVLVRSHRGSTTDRRSAGVADRRGVDRAIVVPRVACMRCRRPCGRGPHDHYLADDLGRASGEVQPPIGSTP